MLLAMTPALKRSLALGAAWTGSAVAAVGLGFLAVSLVGASASPATQPVASGATSSTAGTSPTASPTAPAAASGEHVTLAGTVFADCTGGSPVLAGAPAAGWWVDDSNKPGQVEFENASQKLEVYVACVNGSPSFAVEGPRADANGGRGSSSSSSSSSSSPASSSASESTSGGDDSGGDDDSSGRGSGGGGSDDSDGDSSGRGSGGSGGGSDDD